MRGQFVLWPEEDRQIIVPNNLLDQGEEAFLKMIAQDAQGDVAAAANFYVGLMGDTFAEDTTLATLAGEPAVANGYARKAVARTAGGWPTVGVVNGLWRIASGTLTWTGAGGSFSAAIRRAFLCNAAAGTVGKIFSVSGAFPSAITVLDAMALPLRYELFAR